MSSALGFLSSGQTPGSATGEQQSSSQLPAWYTDYTQQILNKAAQYANEPFPTYQGPRIANQDSLTQDAYSGAAGLGQTAANSTQAGMNLAQQSASQNNPTGAAQPYLNAGATGIAGSVAPGQGGLSAASPYLNNASTPTYDTVQNYMNPYNQDVTNSIAQAGASNFNNNIMPALQSSMVGAGNITGTSTEGAQLANNAALTEQQAVSQAQSQALQSGYAGSQTAATNAANLQAQLGSTAGQLGTQQQTAEQNAGTDLANIGVSAGNLNTQQAQTGLSAAGALSNIGTQGLANQTSALNTQNTLGLQNQGYNQSNLNLAYNDFLQQQQYPMTQASAMQGALSGISVPQAQTTYNYGTYNQPATQVSPIQQATTALGNLSASTTPSASTTNNYGISNLNPYASSSS